MAIENEEAGSVLTAGGADNNNTVNPNVVDQYGYDAAFADLANATPLTPSAFNTGINWGNVGDWAKKMFTGQGGIADYGTLIGGALGLYEAMNKDRSPKMWEGTVQKAAIPQRTVSQDYINAINARPYGAAAQGMDPYTYSAPERPMINLPTNIGTMSAQDKANLYANYRGMGYSDQDIRSRIEKLLGAQAPGDWSYLRNLSGYGFMPQSMAGLTADQKAQLYKRGISSGMSDAALRSLVGTMYGAQTDADWSALKALASGKPAAQTAQTWGGKTVSGTTLPANWDTLSGEAKIKFFNENNFTPAMIKAADPTVTDEDVKSWRASMGYKFAGGGAVPSSDAPMLESGDFVIPADVVSGLGNGSTEPGMAFLQEALDAEPIRGGGDGMSDSLMTRIDGVQPAKVADGEAVVRRAKVEKIGGGDVERGTKELYKMMDQVRRARTGNPKQGKEINPQKFAPGGIAGYAGGGAVAFQTGGSAVNAAGTGGSLSGGLSPWVGAYVAGPEGYLSKAWSLGDQPYEAYKGPLTAGTSPLQQKYFSGIEQLGFPGNLGQSFSASGAYQLPTAGGTPTGPTGIAANYMNPYLSAVLTPQLEEMRRQSEISRKNLGAKFGGAGGGASAFGGGRQAIESAELERNLMQEQNRAIGQAYAGAFDKAMGQFNTEQQQAQGIASMLANAGQQQRGIEQEAVDAQIKQFQEAQMYPYKQLQFQQSMLQGLPVSTSTTTPNNSMFSDLVGGIGGLLGLYKDLKSLGG